MSRMRCRMAWTGLLCLLLPGCGLLIDAVEQVWPMTGNRVEIICERERVQVGLTMEPFRPFVFPAIWTDEGARVTGLDVELINVDTVNEELVSLCDVETHMIVTIRYVEDSATTMLSWPFPVTVECTST